MSEPLQREWRFYIDDMIGFCRKVLAYTQGLDAATFPGSGVNYDAALPDIAWRKVIATRNRLIHGYLGIDNDVLWSIVESDIPQLLNQLQAVER